MLYTPSHAEMGEHPKTKRLARRLGVSLPQAVGHLHLLWHFTLKLAPDGDLTRFDPEDLAEAAGWEGDGAAFVATLQECGWLDGQRIHDWEHYGGKVIRATRDNADRQRRFRERQAAARSNGDVTVTESGGNGDLTVTPTASNGHLTVTSPLRNMRDKKRGEEKRAEENTTPSESRGSAAPDSAVALVAREGTNGVEVAARPNGTLRARYSEQYRKAGDQREKADALGGLFREALGAEPAYPRLMAMAKRVGSGGRMIDLIITASTADITDDPHDYLEKLVQREEEGRSNGRTAGSRRGAGRGDARRMAGAAAYYEGDDRPEDSWSES